MLVNSPQCAGQQHTMKDYRSPNAMMLRSGNRVKVRAWVLRSLGIVCCETQLPASGGCLHKPVFRVQKGNEFGPGVNAR